MTNVANFTISQPDTEYVNYNAALEQRHITTFPSQSHSQWMESFPRNQCLYTSEQKHCSAPAIIPPLLSYYCKNVIRNSQSSYWLCDVCHVFYPREIFAVSILVIDMLDTHLIMAGGESLCLISFWYVWRVEYYILYTYIETYMPG